MATKTKRLRILNEIYTTLPSIECKGLCHASCSYIVVLPIEELNIAQATGTHPKVTPADGPGGEGAPLLDTIDDHCPYLDSLKRCSIHAHRPIICRMFGVVGGMPCPHGCRPTEVFDDNQAYDLFERLRRL